jgi:hypothetical protein
MDDDSFVLTENDGKIITGGYIINDNLLVSSLSGGKKIHMNDDNDSEDELNTLKQYAIPAGLYYVNIPHKIISSEINYSNKNVISDDIFDSLYDNATFQKKSNQNNVSKKQKQKRQQQQQQQQQKQQKNKKTKKNH